MPLRLPAWLVSAVLLVCLASCAPKTTPPVVTTAPRFPEFPFPEVPQDLQAAGVAERYKTGWQFLQSGDFRNAERSLGAVLKTSPAFYPAETALGYVDLAQRDFTDAVDRFDRALERAPQYVPALLGRGEALLAAGRKPEALETLTRVLTVDPTLTEVRRRVEVLKFRTLEDAVSAARSAAAAGRFDEAKSAYERALAASPDSAFLYRDLALVDIKLRTFDAALTHALRATALDPQDPRAWLVLGEVREERGEWEDAIPAYAAARRLEPDNADAAARLARAEERLAVSRLPTEYLEIGDAPDVTRGALAALIGVRLEKFLESVKRRDAVLVTDTRAHWAAPWIHAVTRTGVMEPFPNHTFQPDAVVRRGEFARIASRLLSLIGQQVPAAAERWRQTRTTFSDLGTGHLQYPAASMVVAAGVLDTDRDAFHPTRALTGEEAMGAMKRLEALAAEALAQRP